jgi:hypothetical protein
MVHVAEASKWQSVNPCGFSSLDTGTVHQGGRRLERCRTPRTLRPAATRAFLGPTDLRGWAWSAAVLIAFGVPRQGARGASGLRLDELRFDISRLAELQTYSACDGRELEVREYPSATPGRDEEEKMSKFGELKGPENENGASHRRREGH